jgi:hypothetical protein
VAQVYCWRVVFSRPANAAEAEQDAITLINGAVLQGQVTADCHPPAW